MKASLEEQINNFANRTEKDGVWDKSEEKLENFKLKNSVLPIIYSYMAEQERAHIKIEEG